MCYRKKTLKNPVKDNHRTGFDKHIIKAPCCSCPSCRRVRANEWLVRSYFEYLGNHRQAFFLSLDFAPQYLPTWKGKPCFDSDKMKLFLSRLRYYVGQFRYLYSTDYGGLLQRPHYHMIIVPENHLSSFSFFAAVRKCWWYGNYTNIESIASVNNNKLKAMSYVVSYATKDITWTLDKDKETSDMPRSCRPRIQASKGFGMRALEEGIITPDMLRFGAKVSLPIGKGGTLKSYPIPRYYEMKLCYDYYWNENEKKAELTKNQFGVEVAKNRHNSHYIYFIRRFFASRNVNMSAYFPNDNVNDWRNIVYKCLDDIEDFKEYVYCRSFIDKSEYGDRYHVNFLDSFLCRPMWSYYNMAVSIFDNYEKVLDLVKCDKETEELVNAARLRALKRVESRPSLRRYLIRKNFDFSKLYKPIKISSYVPSNFTRANQISFKSTSP